MPTLPGSDAFEEALAQLVLNAPLTLRAPQHGWLVRASHSGRDADTRWQRLMRKSFVGLCEPGQRRDHCLSLLDDGMGLGECGPGHDYPSACHGGMVPFEAQQALQRWEEGTWALDPE